MLDSSVWMVPFLCLFETKPQEQGSEAVGKLCGEKCYLPCFPSPPKQTKTTTTTKQQHDSDALLCSLCWNSCNATWWATKHWKWWCKCKPASDFLTLKDALKPPCRLLVCAVNVACLELVCLFVCFLSSQSWHRKKNRMFLSKSSHSKAALPLVPTQRDGHCVGDLCCCDWLLMFSRFNDKTTLEGTFSLYIVSYWTMSTEAFRMYAMWICMVFQLCTRCPCSPIYILLSVFLYVLF